MTGSSSDPDQIFFSAYHPDSARANFGPGPGDISSHPTLLDDFDKQRQELDFDTRLELIHEIQRDMAEANFMSPFAGQAGVYARMPQVQGFHFKSSYRVGTETLARAWLDDSKRV